MIVVSFFDSQKQLKQKKNKKKQNELKLIKLRFAATVRSYKKPERQFHNDFSDNFKLYDSLMQNWYLFILPSSTNLLWEYAFYMYFRQFYMR